jgi:nucleoside-diphosphate kinase
MLEVTLGIIKPHAYPERREIKRFIEDRGLSILAEKELGISREVAEKQYETLKGKGYFEDAVRVLSEGRSTILLIYGEDAIRRLVGMAGYKDSRLAEEGTIRRRFGVDNERNAFHRADSMENVKREAGLYFEDDEIPEQASGILKTY